MAMAPWLGGGQNTAGVGQWVDEMLHSATNMADSKPIVTSFFPQPPKAEKLGPWRAACTT
jgi:hypothetical protein